MSGTNDTVQRALMARINYGQDREQTVMLALLAALAFLLITFGVPTVGVLPLLPLGLALLSLHLVWPWAPWHRA